MMSARPRQSTMPPSVPTARTIFNQRGKRRVVLCTDIGFLPHSKLLTAFNINYTAGVRDAAMIGVLYACGLRRSELVALTQADYESSSGKIVVRAGKGNKDRTVYVTGRAQRVVEDWIALRGSHGGPLFNAINKAGNIATCEWHKDEDDPKDRGEWVKGGMTDEAVYLILQKRRDQAGVATFSPHDMRRTFVGDMLEAGADINTVSKLAGHASVTTTGRYDRRKEETKKKAANLLHFPY